MESLIQKIENNCQDDTLCLNTSKLKFKVTELVKNEENSLEQCFQIFSNWKENIFIDELYSFEIRILGDFPIAGSRPIKNASLFSHAFNLIPVQKGDKVKFKFCDSWENIHFMNCRKKLFSPKKVFKFIEEMLNIFKKERIDEIDLFDTFLNDDDKTDWEEDYQKILKTGEEVEIYTKETITSLPKNMENLKIKFSIITYENEHLNL